MAAMKPRTGDGPLEVTKEGRGIIMRVPLEGGGRLVVEFSMPTGIPEAARKPLERAAHTCPVHKSLHPDVAVEVRFDWA